jgi:hypothetical protein
MATPRNGYVFVPDEGFTLVVTISMPDTAKVGEWIPLHATRRNGPWKQIRTEEASAQRLPMYDPPVFEPEVASNLSWIVEPLGSARFDLQTNEDTDIDPNVRMVMFSEPGTYTLTGHSAFPRPASSNAVTIVVTRSAEPPSALDQLRTSRWIFENRPPPQPRMQESFGRHPRYAPGPFNAIDVLTYLDVCLAENPCWAFINLDHPYVNTANSRLTLYADQQRWAIVAEVSGYNARASAFSLTLTYFGNCLIDMPRAGLNDIYTHNMQFIDVLRYEPIGAFLEQVAAGASPVIEVPVRGRTVRVPGTKAGLRKHIPDIESRRWPVDVAAEDLGRYIAYEYPDLCRATDAEKRRLLPQDLPELMTIDEWHHRSFARYQSEDVGDAPSSYETFRLIAEVLATRDPGRYAPTLAPNSHWTTGRRPGRCNSTSGSSPSRRSGDEVQTNNRPGIDRRRYKTHR